MTQQQKAVFAERIHDGVKLHIPEGRLVKDDGGWGEYGYATVTFSIGDATGSHRRSLKSRRRNRPAVRSKEGRNRGGGSPCSPGGNASCSGFSG